jgi:phage gp46-like protein
MTSKMSLAALALAAALLSLPTGADAGFVGRDRFWGDDARMSRLWSFSWLCRDEKQVVVAKKVRRARAVPAK